jgi:hypothetical protein
MLVMERGLTQNNTNTGSYRIRIYEVNFNQAGTTNVAGVNSLIGASYTTLTKTLRWESSSNMDNVESMCFGRDVNGFRTLVLASDNNFNGAQTTQFHVLTTDIPAVTRRTLATAVTGSGSVTAAPSVAWYPDGSEVSLTAMPATSHTFANWTGSVTGSSNPVGLTMDADKSVTANFQTIYASWAIANGVSTDPAANSGANLKAFAFGYTPGNPGALVYTGTFAGGGTITARGEPITVYENITNGVDFRALFCRRKDYLAAGLTYTVQFSPDLSTWKNSTVTPTVIASDAEIDACTVPYPFFVAGKKARFFRVEVSITP